MRFGPKYPDKPALLMELKYNKDILTAAEQVRKKKCENRK